MEVINFGNFQQYQKQVNHLKKLLELLSVVIFDAGVKPEISDELASFDEVIFLELQ